MTIKKVTGFRLSENNLAQLDVLCKKYKTDRSDMVGRLIALYYVMMINDFDSDIYPTHLLESKLTFGL